MALVKYGHIITEAKGSVADTTFQRTRAGQIMHKRMTPRNPRTQYQQIARDNLRMISQTWRTLTDAQRLTWQYYARNVSSKNLLGDELNRAAFNAYMQCNLNLLTIQQSMLSEAPEPIPMPAMESFSTMRAVPSGLLKLEDPLPSPTPPGVWTIFRATPGFSAGNSFFKNKLKLVFALRPESALDYNFFSDYLARGLSFSSGQRVAIEWYFIHELTGQASPRWSLSTIAE